MHSPARPFGWSTEEGIKMNEPYRHLGFNSSECSCSLVHDDELKDEAHSKVINFLGSRCANPKCRWLNEDGTMGCTDTDLLQLDHVYDDGYLERRRRWTWQRVLQALQKGTDRYQLLCACCNWKKRLGSPFAKWVAMSGRRI